MTNEKNCALCLSTESKWLLDVFSEPNRGLDMASIISKHLWFDLNPATEPHICMDCWTTIHNFHRYYAKLETIHGYGAEDGSTIDDGTVTDCDMGELKNIEFLDEDAEELRLQMKQMPNASLDEGTAYGIIKRDPNVSEKHPTHETKNELDEESFRIFEIEVEEDESGAVYRLEDDDHSGKPRTELHRRPVILNGQMKTNSTAESSTVAIDFTVPDDDVPVKRGRGRPRKHPKSESYSPLRIVKQEPNSSLEENNTSMDSQSGTDELTPAKRRRGRPPKNANALQKVSPAVPVPQRALKKEMINTESNDEEMADTDPSRPERRSTRVRKAKYFSDMEQGSEEEDTEEEESEQSEYEIGDDPEYEARLELQKKLNMDDFAFYEYQCSLENEHGARDNKIFQYVDEFACHICVEPVTFKRFAEAHLHYRVEHNQPPYLKCPKCEKKCHTPGMFVSHMETHDDPEKNKCQICGKYTDCNISLKKHMRVHQSQLEENLPYPCSLCKRKFETEELRAKHEKLHVPKPIVPNGKGPDQEVLDFYKVIVCDICEEEQAESPNYENLSDLRAHMVKVHNKSMYLRCPVCSTRQANRHQVITHIDMHNNPDKYRCEVCKEVYQNLHQHMMKAHSANTSEETGKQYTCEQCGRMFNFLANLKMHVDCVHGVKDIKCDVCNKLFNYRAYRTHKRTAHTDLMLMCEHCPKMFKNRKSFEVHKASHAGIMLRMTNCELCGKLIRTCSMSKHMKTIHSEEDPVNCDLCGKMFRTTFHMKRHQKNTCEVTMDSRSFKCEVCGKGFSTKLTMIEHQTTHTRTNQYQCAFCFKSFGYISNLYKHRKKAHPLEWQEVQAHPEENIASVIVVRN